MIIDLLCEQLERSLSDSPVHSHAESVEEGRDVSITAGESSYCSLPFSTPHVLYVSSSHMTNNI